MSFTLSPGLAKVLEIYLEAMNEFDNLHNGLRHVMWAYLEENIDKGLDEKITGNFLKNFDSLMELIWFIYEDMKRENS